MKIRSLYLFSALLLSSTLNAQPSQEKPVPFVAPPSPVETKGQVTIQGKTISYTARTGYLTLKDESGKAKANIFFIAYTRDGVSDLTKRPITYTFNGGPGSASLWLHLGCIGPRRIPMTDKGESLAPPYALVNNEYSWLDKTDLVFIDPVNTGYSRAAAGENEKQFLGYNEDIQSVGEFIRLYTTQYGRWGSPKFLAGESYGTTRAAGLSGYLQDRYNLYINGISLISSILNFQTARFDRGNDLPFALFLPTYTAIAWYHKKLAPEYQADLKKTLQAAREFAAGEYTTALMKGDLLTETEEKALVEKLSKFTGLSQTYLRQTRLRVEIGRFVKELLRSEGKTAGRLDGRMTGTDFDDAGDGYEFDPSLDATISGPYSTALNHYVRQELKYENDLPYLALTGRVQPWNYNNVQNSYLNVSETLRQAMSKNPFLKVWVGAGYYDLATPFFAAEYTFHHMGLKPEQRKNVSFTYYESGHMMYIHKPSLIQLKKDADTFYDQALK
ncbi:peptidase S10 [Siphonobacter sp. BAB-5405]|uniref:S10 family peptidase n=1 Tax=Siphonobacter sp. BAB-5405 TaxID=1864825 RepID=UPI000C80E4B7|nr:peptidase S10 [Siphonobacter sp. BAB-5405]PMD98830.1 peptidase S10 [Siphonobacter sp. BAB-5405]